MGSWTQALFVSLLAFVSSGCSGVSSSRATSATPSTVSSVPARAIPSPSSAPALPNDAIEVAITVDDLPRHGPDLPGITRLSIHERMLAVFLAHRTPPVYGFINAGKLEAHAEDELALRAWVTAGHPLGNHTYSHADGAQVPIADYLVDVDKNEPALERLLPASAEGRRSWKVFRYPFLREGKDSAAQAELRTALAQRGYRVAHVTIDFYDWAFNQAHARCITKNDPASVAALEVDFVDRAVHELRWADGAARELAGRPIKHILLLHVGEFTAQMLHRLLSAYEQNGARFVTLDAALADPIYASEPAQPKPFGNFLWRLKRARGTRAPAAAPPPDTLLDRVCR
jgi:peptidoglycan-N-acetylglucosamine deacetylase